MVAATRRCRPGRTFRHEACCTCLGARTRVLACSVAPAAPPAWASCPRRHALPCLRLFLWVLGVRACRCAPSPRFLSGTVR